jgi:hypothetical protein
MEKKSRKEKNKAFWWLLACRHRKLWLMQFKPTRIEKKWIAGHSGRR